MSHVDITVGAAGSGNGVVLSQSLDYYYPEFVESFDVGSGPSTSGRWVTVTGSRTAGRHRYGWTGGYLDGVFTPTELGAHYWGLGVKITEATEFTWYLIVQTDPVNNPTQFTQWGTLTHTILSDRRMRISISTLDGSSSKVVEYGFFNEWYFLDFGSGLAVFQEQISLTQYRRRFVGTGSFSINPTVGGGGGVSPLGLDYDSGWLIINGTALWTGRQDIDTLRLNVSTGGVLDDFYHNSIQEIEFANYALGDGEAAPDNQPVWIVDPNAKPQATHSFYEVAIQQSSVPRITHSFYEVQVQQTGQPQITHSFYEVYTKKLEAYIASKGFWIMSE